MREIDEKFSAYPPKGSRERPSELGHDRETVKRQIVSADLCRIRIKPRISCTYEWLQSRVSPGGPKQCGGRGAGD